MTNAQRVKALAIARANGGGHAPLRWVWPDEHNRFDTGLPAKKKAHPNAHKCNFTQLPGCANARHKRRQRALSNRSGRIASAR